MKATKLEPPLFLNMEFGEALARYAQTDPAEVEAPSGRKPKKGRGAELGEEKTPGLGERPAGPAAQPE